MNCCIQSDFINPAYPHLIPLGVFPETRGTIPIVGLDSRSDLADVWLSDMKSQTGDISLGVFLYV